MSLNMVEMPGIEPESNVVKTCLYCHELFVLCLTRKRTKKKARGLMLDYGGMVTSNHVPSC